MLTKRFRAQYHECMNFFKNLSCQLYYMGQVKLSQCDNTRL